MEIDRFCAKNVRSAVWFFRPSRGAEKPLQRQRLDASYDVPLCRPSQSANRLLQVTGFLPFSFTLEILTTLELELAWQILPPPM